MYKLQVSTGNGGGGEPTEYFDTFEDALEAANEVYFDGHPNGDDPLTKDDIRDWYDYDYEKYHLKVYILDEDDNFLLDRCVYKHFKTNNPV
jgi:hypothetical protein